MNLVRLDDFATLYTVTSVAGRGGVPVETRVVAGRLNVGKVKQSGSTVLKAGRDAIDQMDVFQCRWFDGFKPGFRMDCNGVSYKILRVDELGRREAYQFYCQAIK